MVFFLLVGHSLSDRINTYCQVLTFEFGEGSVPISPIAKSPSLNLSRYNTPRGKPEGRTSLEVQSSRPSCSADNSSP